MSAFIPIEFQKTFDKTRQNAVAITATRGQQANALSSCFGGFPYWESDVELPLDDNGETLALLAQINFSEVPETDDLPNQGIVQFFIPRHDEWYGADVESIGGRGKMQVYFWQNPSIDKHHAWQPVVSEKDLLPVYGAHKLTFARKDDYAGIDTIECAAALNANPFEVLEDITLNSKEENAFYDAIVDYTASQGHKLLGYPYFPQSEPRTDKEYRLLLQIDTDMDGDNDIMWGNNGVGHLFIREQDLQACRFDKVWFVWDCF